MKKIFFIFGIFSIIIFTLIYSQEDIAVVDNSIFVKPERPPSLFIHNEHNKNAKIKNCNTCHHVYKNGKYIQNESSIALSCSDCHKLKSDGEIPGLMEAFHINCKGCHKKRKAGPLMCGDCHKK